MKTLFILRHAQALPDRGEGDAARKLTPQGLADAAALGKAMAAKNYKPQFVLCSPALRTRDTLAQIIESLPKAVAAYERLIYEGGQGDLLALIQGFSDSYDAAMIVGHNPSIHQLAAGLAADDGSPLAQNLAYGYAPGTLTVLSCPRASWADIQKGENRIADLVAP